MMDIVIRNDRWGRIAPIRHLDTCLTTRIGGGNRYTINAMAGRDIDLRRPSPSREADPDIQNVLIAVY